MSKLGGVDLGGTKIQTVIGRRRAHGARLGAAADADQRGPADVARRSKVRCATPPRRPTSSPRSSPAWASDRRGRSTAAR